MISPTKRIRPSKKPRLTIHDVAARAGVSTATVSRVLSGKEGAGNEVRDRVLKAVQDLDFHPNRMARGLRSKSRKVVAVVIPDLQNPFFTGVVHGVEEVLCEAGYTLLLGHSDGRADREARHFSVFRGEGVDGLVLVPSNADGADYSGLAAWKTPLVAVDRSPKGVVVDLVQSDNRRGAGEAIAHLIAQGHRKIGLINGPGSLDVSEQRYAGYRDALTSAGIKVTKNWIQEGDFREESGRQAMKKLLGLSRPPEAVLVANNLMTLGALAAIHDAGKKVPTDLAIISFDDMPWAACIRPPLTAIAQPAEELGRSAAMLLLERIGAPERLTRNVILRTHLMVRASCGAAPGKNVAEPSESEAIKHKNSAAHLSAMVSRTSPLNAATLN